jgi:hypothetical protein
LLSSRPSYSDGVAVIFAMALGTTARDGDGVAVGIAASFETTLVAISVAAASMTIARDGDDRDGAAVSITAALGMTAAVTTLEQVAMPVPSVISSAAKISLRTNFEGFNWLRNKALPRGAEFFDGLLRKIAKQHGLRKLQVARQLLKYMRGKFMNTQISILLNQLDIDERLREGIGCMSEFASLTLEQINLNVSSRSSDFNNMCIMMSFFPVTARTYVWLLASGPDDACFCLLVSVVESQIFSMVARFPRIVARLPNAQIEFEREK